MSNQNEDRESVGTGTAVIVPFAEWHSSLSKELGTQGHAALCYLGHDTLRAIEIKRDLPPECDFIEVGDALNEMFDLIGDELINLDNCVLDEGADMLAWAASNIANISPYANDLPVWLSQLLLVLRWQTDGRRRVYVVDDTDFGVALARAINDNAGLAVWRGRTRCSLTWVSAVRARVSAIRTFVRQKNDCRRMRKVTPTGWAALRECEVLLIDWAEPGAGREWLEHGETRNLKRATRILVEAGYRVGFLAMPLYWISPHRKIIETMFVQEKPILSIRECVGWRDVFRAAWRSWHLSSGAKKRTVIGGKNVHALVNLAWRKDRASDTPTLSGSLVGVGRWMKRFGITPTAIVMPFENQGWERALLKGFRESHPETKIVSCQCSPFAERYLSFFPSGKTLESGGLPNRLLVMGEIYRDWFIKRGFPQDQVQTLGALMFEQQIAGHGERVEKKPHQHTTRVLCATSIKLSEALDLVTKVIDAARDHSNVEIVVGFHPVVDMEFRNTVAEQLGRQFNNDLSNVTFSDRRTKDLIEGECVVFFNTSGAVFDAIMGGCRSVYVPISGYLSLNKIPDSLGLVETCLDHASLERVFDRISGGEHVEIESRRTIDVSPCMGPVVKDIMVQAVTVTKES